MPTRQGDVALLKDPVAQQLLQSKIPARFAYTWRDGTTRGVPIGFHWNGQELVLGTFPDAPKMKALKDGAKVALTIDSDTMPHKVLLVRGTVRTDEVDGVAPEYAAMCRRTMGEEAGGAWVAQAEGIVPRMARISSGRNGSRSRTSRPASRTPSSGRSSVLSRPGDSRVPVAGRSVGRG